VCLCAGSSLAAPPVLLGVQQVAGGAGFLSACGRRPSVAPTRAAPNDDDDHHHNGVLLKTVAAAVRLVAVAKIKCESRPSQSGRLIGSSSCDDDGLLIGTASLEWASSAPPPTSPAGRSLRFHGQLRPNQRSHRPAGRTATGRHDNDDADEQAVSGRRRYPSCWCCRPSRHRHSHRTWTQTCWTWTWTRARTGTRLLPARARSPGRLIHN
jgi:hypothetical protein